MEPDTETASYKLEQHMNLDATEGSATFYPETHRLLVTPSPQMKNNQFGAIEAIAETQEKNSYYKSPSFNSLEPQFQPTDIQELSSNSAYLYTSSGSSSNIGSPLSPQGYLNPFGYNLLIPEWSLPGHNSTEKFSIKSDFLNQGISELSYLAQSLEELSPKEKTIQTTNNIFQETTSNANLQYINETESIFQADPNEVKPADLQIFPVLTHKNKIYQTENRKCTSLVNTSSPYLSSASPLCQEISPKTHHDRVNKLGNADHSVKTKCTYPDCGKIFKDLKAHMLTHQNERPEKCPIATCEYHVKGFARKYDKNRHTLTHFKGTMICGFCPESKPSTKKTFNRADVFKRHLTSAHAVEQSPPNSKRKTSKAEVSDRQGKSLKQPSKASGKCSTCLEIFGNAQDFYEHLDDCVLQTVQRQDPSEVINVARLAEVEHDQDVQDTLRMNAVMSIPKSDGLQNEDLCKNEFGYIYPQNLASQKHRTAQKTMENSRKLKRHPYSKFLAVQNIKSSKRGKELPFSWACPSQIKSKKRVLCLFNGPRRFWKDEINLDINHESELKLDPNHKFLDSIDAQTVQRANSMHTAAEENPDLYLSGDLSSLFFMKSKHRESTQFSST
ncbi:C2H2 finger domain-containing protein [Blumeria hordei DH14]|uniref:C2H2 finger domain-containing protein n=1 Tax=Blumeria graminis f. sp. hordei (strain DH14) TaxID=546991 RepID=N1JPW5_BLUG1|nr:C2H2 finger domain-containing protein [Blumeria hordei DH14]